MSFKKFVFQSFVKPFLSESHVMPEPESFLTEPISVASPADLEGGRDFTSRIIAVEGRTGSIMISCKRKNRTDQLISEFEFEASPDQGRTWYHFFTIQVSPEKGRILRQIDLRGATHVRLGRIVNHGVLFEIIEVMIFF